MSGDTVDRDVLRAELRAGLAEQTNALRIEMDARFAPVNEHIARVDRGELTLAQKAAIVSVVQTSRDERAGRRAMRMPVIAVCLSAISLLAMIAFTLAGSSGGL